MYVWDSKLNSTITSFTGKYKTNLIDYLLIVQSYRHLVAVVKLVTNRVYTNIPTKSKQPYLYKRRIFYV